MNSDSTTFIFAVISLKLGTYVSGAWTKIKTFGNILDHINYNLYAKILHHFCDLLVPK